MNRFEVLQQITFERFPDIHRHKGKLIAPHPLDTIVNTLYVQAQERGVKISIKDIKIFLNSENIPIK